MADSTRLLVAFAVASLAVYFATPIAIRVAAQIDFYDKPRGYRGHERPTPYLGGATVMAGFAITIAVLGQDVGRTWPLLAGVATLWVIGTVDDRQDVSPAFRVLAEVGLAAGIWATGLGWDLGLGWVADLGATCFWILGIVNAFNLFDNMDGAASSMALVVSVAIAIVGAINADAWLTVAGAALAGACLGFLPHNLARPGAKIFLGDGGSMPLGFAVAVLAMATAAGTAPEWQSLAAGLLLVGVPALDTCLVIVSRRRKGISVMTGGRDHLTHRTRRRLGSARTVAFMLGSVQALVSTLVIIAGEHGSASLLIVAVGLIAVAGGVIATLEVEEDRLLAAGEVSVPTAALDVAAERRKRRPNPWSTGDAVVLLVAIGAGTSPFFFGFYDSTKWVPIGLAVITLAAAAAIRQSPRMTLGGVLLLGGAVGYGLWSLLSSGYAGSAEAALVESTRWLVLAGVAGLALVLLRVARRDILVIAGLALGIAVVAGDVVVRMAGSGAGDLFLAGRLNQPLGYINAEATVFVMGFWLCFAAVERRRAWVAGLGVACATLLGCLVLLSESRGAAIAVLGSSIVTVAVLPGRQRRVAALALISGGIAVAGHALLHVYDVSAGGTTPSDAVHHALLAAALAAAATGTLWAGAVAVHERVMDEQGHRAGARLGQLAGLVAVACVLTLGVVESGRISRSAHHQWHAFTHVAEPGGSVVDTASSGTRLVSGAGNRYDYWRVAWHTFTDHPTRGIGAGNFSQAWFAERRTPEDVRQPHSIELQALSDGGLLGGMMLAIFLAGIAVGVARAPRIIRRDPASIVAVVPAVGVMTAWLVDTSVDWMHLLVGVTAIPLLAFSIVLRPRPGIDTGLGVSKLPRPVQLGGAIAVVAVIAVAGALLTRQGLAERFLDRSVSTVAQYPRRALNDAQRSLRLDADNVRAYYAKAAAQARLHQGAAATATLEEAARREPANFVTWTLLGDLQTRRGDAAAAHRNYARAFVLNPLEPGLGDLARQPPASAP